MILVRNEVLLPVARFLARAWSDNQQVEVRIVRTVDSAFTTKLPNGSYLIALLPPSAFFTSHLISAYRMWRADVWHEAMHVLFRSLDFLIKDKQSNILTFVWNIIEDYRVNNLGFRLYPAMKREIDLYYAAVYEISQPIDDPVRMFGQLLLWGTTKSVVPVPDRVFQAVKYVRTVLPSATSPQDTWDMAHKVCEILGVDWDDIAPPSIAIRDNNKTTTLSERSLKKAVQEFQESRRKYQDKLEPQGDNRDEHNSPKAGDEDLLEVSPEIQSEFEYIQTESEKIEHGTKSDRSLIGDALTVPSKLDEDESPYYDYDLIAHLKAELQRLKKKFHEYASTTGEFDTETYLTAQKLLDEERVKVGGLRVLVLLDHSGSIWKLQKEYKKVCTALGEVFNYLGIDFSMFTFSAWGSSYKATLYLIKSFKEKWNRVKARRLAQIPASGGTPLGDAYEKLLPYVKNYAIAKNRFIFVTLTDGEPDSFTQALRLIRTLKQHCHMVAIGFGVTMSDVLTISQRLTELGYERYVATDNIMKLPEKIFSLLGEFG